jgi:crotonobetainyl-CoA:carnitine CoA-transferase CaiB-like acyl-CoA transferase
MIPTEEMWARFCRALGREDLIRHPQLSSGPLRGKHYDDLLKPILDEWMGQRINEEVIQILLKHGVPVGPSQNARDLVHCPQLAARKMIVDIPDPVGGKKKLVGFSVKLSEVPEIDLDPAPSLGANNREVLGSLLGFSAEEIAALEKQKVI